MNRDELESELKAVLNRAHMSEELTADEIAEVVAAFHRSEENARAVLGGGD